MFYSTFGSLRPYGTYCPVVFFCGVLCTLSFPCHFSASILNVRLVIARYTPNASSARVLLLATSSVTRPPLLLVVGMHRGGTSLLGGVLQRLGVELPGETIAGDLHNLKTAEWDAVVSFRSGCSST